MPKFAGGLGIRRAWDINIAFITELGWLVCTDLSKTWVKLIRSKYLRGRRITSFQCTSRSSSWIWKGIKSCKNSLDNDICFQVGQNSRIRVRENPWIPDTPLFRILAEVTISGNIHYVCDLMNWQKMEWNAQLLQDIVPPELCRIIHSIPIVEREQDRLLWIPNSSREFFVRSTYRINNYARFSTASRSDKKVWLLLWKSPLHERHKVMIWRILNNIIPTKDRLQGLFQQTDLHCFLCSNANESIDHLLLDYPVAIMCWLQSPWQIRINHFTDDGSTKWFQLLLEENNCFDVEKEEKLRILIYVCIVFE